MSRSGEDYLREGFTLMTDALRPFVEQRLSQKYGSGWKLTVIERLNMLPANFRPADPVLWLKILREFWTGFFEKSFKGYRRSTIFELIDLRNMQAHHEPLDRNDIRRGLTSIRDLLSDLSGKAAAPLAQVISDFEGIAPRVLKPDTAPLSAPEAKAQDTPRASSLARIAVNPHEAWVVRPYPHYKDRRREFLSAGIIAVGWWPLGGIGNASRTDVMAKLQLDYPEREARWAYDLGVLLRFRDEILDGDLVVMAPYTKDDHRVAIGLVAGPYHFVAAVANESGGYPHQRTVQWFPIGAAPELVPRKDLPDRVVVTLNHRAIIVRTACAALANFCEDKGWIKLG
jgi:hypothetical protein